MAIRDRINRMIRKSVSSSSSSGGNTSPTTDDGHDHITAATTAPLSKPHSRFGKMASWRSDKASPSTSSAPKSSKPPARHQKQRLHPSERPLTETNLRHQEMLGTFTLKFGGGGGRSRRLSRGQMTCYSGISPGNSRPASMDQPPAAAAAAHGLAGSRAAGPTASAAAAAPQQGLLVPPGEVDSDLER